MAVLCLPRRTRVAMLEAIATNEIIVGAYANRDGVCPMLAAHRAGGRTNLISFAKAWDRFAFRDSRRTRARRATERELRVLRAHLESSLLAEDAPESDLAAACSEHLELMRRHQRARTLARLESEPVVACLDGREPASVVAGLDACEPALSG
ncbi:MAG: hypothetical protein ACR2MK_10185 [Solirubrobacteraceae bacterium]